MVNAPEPGTASVGFWGPVAPRNPWWIPPFLGGVPEIDGKHLRLLGWVSLALFFESYAFSMLLSALKFIAADLHIDQGALGGKLSIIRLGALPALLLVPGADLFGRRRLFLGAVVGMSLGTFFTAFVRSSTEFVMLQMLTQMFLIAGGATAVVILTEEFPAVHRGWGLGMLGALSACGHGFGAVLFAAINYLPYGWRTLYAVGIVPLLFSSILRREVRETSRFERYHERRALAGRDTGGAWRWLEPFRSLARTHPLRALGITIVGGLFAFGEVSVFQFAGYFALTEHDWSPAAFSAMVILGGAIGIIGNVAAGELGDRIGRRAVGALFLAMFPLSALMFYQGPGWILPCAWILMVFCDSAGWVMLRALSSELFPTSHRGTSTGWFSFIQNVAAAAGLGVVGLLTSRGGHLAQVTSVLALATLGGPLVLLSFPETRRQELEAISMEESL